MDSIVTLTMNPALDITTDADVVRPTDKVRCAGVRYDPGGGGVNVAQVAHNLGASVTAVFPAGGATGDVYGDLLNARGVPFHRVKIAGTTRESSASLNSASWPRRPTLSWRAEVSRRVHPAISTSRWLWSAGISACGWFWTPPAVASATSPPVCSC